MPFVLLERLVAITINGVLNMIYIMGVVVKSFLESNRFRGVSAIIIALSLVTTRTGPSQEFGMMYFSETQKSK